MVANYESQVEGFQYKSFPPDLVEVILVRYLAGNTLEKLAMEIPGVSFASAGRIIDHAVEIGVLSPEDKHPKGGGFAIKRAKAALERHPDASPSEIARLAGCGQATVFRAKKLNAFS